MDGWLYRPVFTRALTGVMALLLATAFRQWLDIAGVVHDPGIARRLALAFLFWCEFIVLIPRPPAGLHIVTVSIALVMFTSTASAFVEATVTYVLTGVLSLDAPYTIIFGVIAMPVFLVSATIVEFTGQAKPGWLSWLVQNPWFVFIGTVCSILGLILTVWPWKDIVGILAGTAP